MKNLFLAAVAALLMLSSCSKVFYQVYDTKAPGMVEEGSSLVYENEDCKLMYNLWAEDGNAGFVMQNKTDNDLFLILSQTFFIKNGTAFDYFKNREFSNTESAGAASSVAVSSAVVSGAAVSSAAVSSVTVGDASYGIANIWGMWYNAAQAATVRTAKNKGYSSTVTTKEAPIVCIPAKSSKFIKEYAISGRLMKNCNKRQAYPKKRSIPVTFTKEDTPLVFKNRISYSFDKDGTGLKQVENEFWISEVINYTKKEALEKEKMAECEEDIAEIVYVFKMASPRKFYNSYLGGSVGGKNTNKGKIVGWQ